MTHPADRGPSSRPTVRRWRGTCRSTDCRIGQIDIGWSLHPDATGRGLATEAAALLLDRARSAGVPKVYAVMWPENLASAAVASSIGMADLGVVADPWYGTEQDPDSRIFVWPPSASPDL